MRRFPGLTLTMAAVTLGGLAIQESVPGTLAHLERTPAALHGDWWRWVTALVVQDGHWAGGLFNLLGLVLCGVAAEQVLGRWAWLTAYLGAGLVGQAIGQAWQPTGGGNSVAVCGLAGRGPVGAAARAGRSSWNLGGRTAGQASLVTPAGSRGLRGLCGRARPRKGPPRRHAVRGVGGSRTDRTARRSPERR